MENYNEFLQSKIAKIKKSGFTPTSLNENLKDFQVHVVQTALEHGRYAIFGDTGTGKTIMQLSFADEILKKTNKPVLILAPLAVSGQTIEEGVKFGIKVEKFKNQTSV